MFIGRIQELEELESRYNSGKFELGVIYGSRRIGKTSLIKAFLEGKDTLYYRVKRTGCFDSSSKKRRCNGAGVLYCKESSLAAPLIL